MSTLFIVDNYSGQKDKFVENWKEFPIYFINNKYVCNTDSFITERETLEEVREDIDKLLCDKRLLTPYGTYTKEAYELSEKVGTVLRQIVCECRDKGYNLEDVDRIIYNSVNMICITERMKRTLNIKKGKYKK